MIIDEGNGWRDLTDEGPGMRVNSEKEGYELLQSEHALRVTVMGPERVSGGRRTAQQVELGTFPSKERAKFYADALIESRRPANSEVLFLLEQLRLRDEYQDKERLKQLQRKYEGKY